MMARMRGFLKNWFSSLFGLTISIALGTIFTLGIVSSIFSYYQIEGTLLNALETKGKDLASELSITASELLGHNDLAAVQRVLSQIDSSGELEDVIVIDTHGLIIAEKQLPSAANLDVPGYQDKVMQMDALRQALDNGSEKAFQDEQDFFAIHPIYQAGRHAGGSAVIIGAVIVKMGMGSINAERLKESSQRGWFNMLLLFLMGGVIGPLVGFMVVEPLKAITSATQRIAEGALNTKVQVGGTREIRTLAMSLNQMAEDMQASRCEMQKRLDEMKILYDISAVISKTLDVDELLGFLANHLARLIDGTGAFIVLWDEARKTAVPQAAYGTFDQRYQTIHQWPDEPTLTAKVVETGLPIAVYDVLNSPYISHRIAAQFPDKSLLGLPLIVNQRPIGAALIGETRQKRVFTDDEIRVAMSAAGQIAAAIANAQLFQALSSERNRLNDILNAVSDAIIVCNTEGQIQYANRAFNTMTSQEVAKVAAHPWQLVRIKDEELPAIFTEISEAHARGSNWRREMVAYRPNGETYDVDLAVAPIHDADGKVASYVVSVRDISNLKELDRMKTRFVSTVSHELRTPLSVINLHAENFLEFYDRLSDDQRRKILVDIHAETKILHQLIEDLLSLSRLDSGRAEPRRNLFNLGKVLSESIASSRPLAEKKEISLSCDLPESYISIFGDYDQMGQVFRNILSNSIKFTPAGGQVKISCGLHEREIVVAIADTGIGIPAADLPRLFDRFYRSELSIQQEIPGTGLGLAICGEIIQRHQGKIEVESEVGKGSTFRIHIPLAEEQYLIYQ